VEQNISISKHYLNKLNDEIEKVSATVVRMEDSLRIENEKLAVRQVSMKKRLRSIYKSGQLEVPQIMMSSRSMSALLHRGRYFEGLHFYDLLLLRQIDSVRSSIQLYTTNLQHRLRPAFIT